MLAKRLSTFARVRFASSLVFVEHEQGKIVPSTLNALTAASKLGNVTAVVAGTGSKAVSESVAKLDHVSSVIVAENATYDHFLPEKVAPLLLKLQNEKKYTHIVAAHSAIGKNILPRLAASLDVAPLSDITGIVDEETFTRPIYAGNAISTVKSKDAVKVLTVRGTSFAPAAESNKTAEISEAPVAESTGTFNSVCCDISSKCRMAQARNTEIRSTRS